MSNRRNESFPPKLYVSESLMGELFYVEETKGWHDLYDVRFDSVRILVL